MGMEQNLNMLKIKRLVEVRVVAGKQKPPLDSYTCA